MTRRRTIRPCRCCCTVNVVPAEERSRRGDLVRAPLRPDMAGRMAGETASIRSCTFTPARMRCWVSRLVEATVQFGGAAGRALEVGAGDVVVLPAGTGPSASCMRSTDLLVIGAYPRNGRFDQKRPGEMEGEAARRAVAAVPLPEMDPVAGAARAADWICGDGAVTITSRRSSRTGDRRPASGRGRRPCPSRRS